MSYICLAVIAAIGIWFHYGNAALGTTATLASMIVAGVGVESFLNTFWKDRPRNAKRTSEMHFWQPRQINILVRTRSRNTEIPSAHPATYLETSEFVRPLSRRRRELAGEEY